MRYYDIARLKHDISLILAEGEMHVNLDRLSDSDHIHNDSELAASQQSGVYFYLSGGGSLLINGRYIPVLKRSETAAFNPGKISLFTGRAEGQEEWQKPELVVRELFEELRIYKANMPLIPRCPAYQTIINKIYGDMQGEALDMTPIPLANTRLYIRSGGQEHSTDAFLHISERGDINSLFLFSTALDLQEVRMADAEGERPVFLLDRKTLEFVETNGTRREPCDKSSMTSHLAALLEKLNEIYC